MRQEQLTEEYLSRFPTKLHSVLEIEKFRNRFLSRVVDDYPQTTVYRGIHRKDSVCADDFLSNVDEAECYGRRPPRQSLEANAVSVNEDPQQIITALHIPDASRPMLGVAKGVMRSDFGPADFSSFDGVPVTHHNWYLFQDKVQEAVGTFSAIDLSE